MKFEIYKDVNGEWRFRLRAVNGEIIATGESYKNKFDCLRTVESIRQLCHYSKVVFLDE